MSKTLIITLLALLGLGLYFSSQKQPSPQASPTPSMVVAASSSPLQLSNSRYLPYTKELFASNIRPRRVLFFYASWCPTCIPADQDIANQQSAIPEDVFVFRVNYNDPETDADEKALAKQYGITYQHTFVQLDSENQVVAKWNGGKSAELIKNIK